MANLWEIDEEIMTSCIDVETGEILDIEKLQSLEFEKDKKIENISKWIKNLESDIAALKEQEKSFADRRKSAENKMNDLKKYLSDYLNGEKWVASDQSVAISFRKSESVNILDEERIPSDFMKEEIKRTADKMAIKKAIKGGQTVAGCELVENRNIQIK